MMKDIKLLLFILPLLFVGCGGDTTNGNNNIIGFSKPAGSGSTGTNTDPVITNGPKTFTDVHEALKAKCLVCHGTSGGFTLGSTAAPLPETEAYNNIMLFVSGASSAANTLLLQKATGSLGHGGGMVFNTTSYYYELVTKWIEAGTPSDQTSFTVNSSTQTDPGYDTPSVAASTFTQNHKGGFGPVQGKACIICHRAEENKDIVRFGGTLFSYIHTPNGKYYQDLSSYKVNIVGDYGTTMTASVQNPGSSIGHNNFYVSTENGSFVSGEVFTVNIKDSNGNIVNQSGSNTHSSTMHTDCNSCHTELGSNSVPGRVLVPLVN